MLEPLKWWELKQEQRLLEKEGYEILSRVKQRVRQAKKGNRYHQDQRDLDRCLREWGVSKVFTATVDNTSSNSTSLNQLKGKLIARGSDFMKGINWSFVDFALREEHGSELGSKLATDTREAIREMFEEYKLIFQPIVTQPQSDQDPSSNTTNSSSDCSRKRSQSALGDRFIRHKMESGEVESRCELDIYLKESVFVTKNEEFDILNWWKLNSSRFPILSQLARDVLAIPISTVASESAFSTGGRVLDASRSSLTPKVVESLLCAQNWLRKSKHHNSVEEDMISIEKIESAISVEKTDETVIQVD